MLIRLRIRGTTMKLAKTYNRDKPEGNEFRVMLPATEVRASDDGKSLEGYAAKFNTRSQLLYGFFYEEIAPGAFARSLAESDIRALVDHDSGKVLARNKSNTLTLVEDQTGLRFSLSLPDVSYARDLSTLVKRGDISGMSFGFMTREDKWTYSDDPSEPVLRTLLDVDLREISVVAFPAYEDTQVSVRCYREFMDHVERSMGVHVDVLEKELALKEKF